MAAISHRAATRVVCRVFIKAPPQAVWDAICPALKQDGADVSPGGISVRSGALSFELRDTLTGYTALTVSCEPADAPAAPDSGAVSACDWDRLLGDLKTELEAGRRGRQRTGPVRSSTRWPLQLRPKLAPQALAFSGGRLSPD